MPQTKKPYIFLVMGPQGSGKGTQGELLAKKFKLGFFGAGDMLRQMARQNTPRGRQIKKTIDGGNLVPWPWVVEMALEQIKKNPKNKGIVYDGLSRRLPEAKAFLKMIRQTGREITAVFFIDIPEQETIKRLSKRLICENRHIFTIGVGIKKGRKTCPKCGAPVFHRDDDKPKAIKKRLMDYRQKTLPALNYFKQEGLLIKINGQQPVKKVFADILKAIKKLEK
ncbi:MAG: nucleoside monophosphate kinase [bacterium]